MGTRKSEISILKTLWSKREDGEWQISGMKGLSISSSGQESDGHFEIADELVLLTNTPPTNVFDAFGHTQHLLRQSILPVVAFRDGDSTGRCIGSSFLISCSGYLMTACHVLLDPVESGYGKVTRTGNTLNFEQGLTMGVLVPLHPAMGQSGYIFYPFVASWYWGEWKRPPLIHEDDRFEMLTDIAICKIPEAASGTFHQPLTLSLNSFSIGENAYAIGYANMADIDVNASGPGSTFKIPNHRLFASTGTVSGLFPNNHLEKNVPTPGPCFEMKAKLPGKMSGSPIFGGDGAVVRGVVSRSVSAERLGYGAMLGPVMHLPLYEGVTLYGLMENSKEGIGRIHGQGL